MIADTPLVMLGMAVCRIARDSSSPGRHLGLPSPAAKIAPPQEGQVQRACISPCDSSNSVWMKILPFPNDFSRAKFRHVVSAQSCCQSVTAAECHVAQPGEEVELPLTEIKQLQALGFLVDPDRIATDVDVKKADALARSGQRQQ